MVGLRDVEALFLAHGKGHIWEHSKAVAEEISLIAAQYGQPSETCRTAALCHDIAGILSPEDMLRQAMAEGITLDPAEALHPFLLHQRFSCRICADRLGVTDQAALSAIGCHTTLKAGASAADMALFLADKLRWDQKGPPPFEAAVRKALCGSLERACLAYMDYALETGMILMPHRWLLEARQWLIPFSVSF